MMLLIISDDMKNKGYEIVFFYFYSKRIRAVSIIKKIDKFSKKNELFE